MSLSHSHWKVSRTSASLVWEISKPLKVSSCFSVPKFDLLLFYLMEKSTSATYNISQTNWVVFGSCLINVREKCHFSDCSFSHSFVGICDIYPENNLLNVYFGFDIGKPIPVFLYWNHQHINTHLFDLLYFFACSILFKRSNAYYFKIKSLLPLPLFCIYLMK